MAKLDLMRNDMELLEHRTLVWNNAVGEGRPPNLACHRFPCLAKVVALRYAFNLGSIGTLVVSCTREEAKRIVYPKTNRNRSQIGLTIIEGQHLANSIDEHITHTFQRLGDRHLDLSNPIQRAMIDSAISDLDGVSGLALVTSRVYTAVDKLKLIDFFTVDELAARNLVYLNKGPSNKLKALYPRLKYQSAKAKSVEKHVQEIDIDTDFNRFAHDCGLAHYNSE